MNKPAISIVISYDATHLQEFIERQLPGFDVTFVTAAASEPSAEPVAYQYLFRDPLGGGPVWRNSPSEWNGQKPHGSKPLYTHPPSDELEALRMDATRYRWLKGLNDGVILIQDDDGILIEDAADTAIDEDTDRHGGKSDG